MTEENSCRTVLMISVDQSVNFHLLIRWKFLIVIWAGIFPYLGNLIRILISSLNTLTEGQELRLSFILFSLQVKKKPFLTLGGDVVVVVDVICVNRCVILFYTLNKNNKFGTYKKQHGKKWCTFINSYLRLKTRRVSSPPFVLVWSCCVAVATRHRRPCSLE